MAEKPHPTTPEQRPAARRRVRDLAAINDEVRRLYPNTLQRSQDVRKMLRHEYHAPLPKRFLEEGAQFFMVDSVRKYKRVKDVMASFTKRWPELVRHHPMGTGPASNSTKIEQGVTAIMRSDQRGVGWPKEAVVDCLVNEGVGCVITQPLGTFWQQVPKSLHERDPKRDEEREQAWERTRREAVEEKRVPTTPYTRSNPGDVIREEYRRDKAGRDAEHDYYRMNKKRKFTPDHDASEKAFHEHRDWLKAREIPLIQRSISCDQGLPLFGATGRLEAFIVAGQYAVPTLTREKLSWYDDDKQVMMGYGAVPGYGVDATQPASTMRTVYEYWSYGCERDENHPGVEYQVEKCDTWRAGPKGELTEPFICFGCEYSMTRLPIAWCPGQGYRGSSSPDDHCWAIPYDYLQNDAAVDNALTGQLTAYWRVGWPTFHAKPDAQALSLPEVGAETDEPEPLVIEPLTLIRSNDTITQIGGASPASGMMELVAYLTADSEQAAPNVTGGTGSGDSALAQATAARFGKDELSHVENALLRLYAESASYVAEIAACIGKKHGPVAIFEMVETPVAAYGSRREETPRAVLTIEPKWFGTPPVYDLDAIMPIRPGDNIPLTQQLADLHDRAVVDMQFVHEHGLGITDSENMQARVKAEQLRNTPAGEARLLALVAELQGDEEEAEMARMKAAALLSEAVGLPPEMGAGLPPASPEAMAAMAMQQAGGAGMGAPMGAAGPQEFQGGGMTGTSMPNFAASSLGGQVAGAMAAGGQQQAANLGAPIPMAGAV